MAYAEFDDLESLVAHHQYEAALAWLDEHMDEYPKRYYYLLVTRLMCLEGLERYQDMVPILAEELGLPYIPQPYHDQLKDLNHHMQLHLKPRTFTSSESLRLLSNSELVQQLPHLLLSPQLDVTLHEIAERSIPALLPAIQQLFLDAAYPQPIKSLVLDVLVRQGVQEEVSFVVDHLHLDVVPAELDALDQLPLIDGVITPLVDQLNQPNATYFFEQLLSGYILHHYPLVPDEDEWEALCHALHAVLKDQLQLAPLLNPQEACSEHELALRDQYTREFRQIIQSF